MVLFDIANMADLVGFMFQKVSINAVIDEIQSIIHELTENKRALTQIFSEFYRLPI